MADLSTTDDFRRPPRAPGEQVLLDGRYELRELVGRGGMGLVYRAHDTRIGRDVAVKIVRGGHRAGTIGARRIQREARNAGRLQHPNIVRVFDVGFLEDGEAYLVMELVDGVPLSQLKLPLEPALALDLTAQLCDALATAHAAGVVHRDVKPGNVIVETHAPRLTARILDFGVSRCTFEPSGLTRDGCFVGTARYAAPEQGESAAVGPSADIYAVGVVLFELLAGHPPFDGPNDAAMLYQHVHTPPPDLRTAAPDVDAEIASLVATCLAKSPTGRPASAADLRDMLISLRGSEPPIDPTWERRAREVDTESDDRDVAFRDTLSIGFAGRLDSGTAGSPAPVVATEPARNLTRRTQTGRGFLGLVLPPAVRVVASVALAVGVVAFVGATTARSSTVSRSFDPATPPAVTAAPEFEAVGHSGGSTPMPAESVIAVASDVDSRTVVADSVEVARAKGAARAIAASLQERALGSFLHGPSTADAATGVPPVDRSHDNALPERTRTGAVVARHQPNRSEDRAAPRSDVSAQSTDVPSHAAAALPGPQPAAEAPPSSPSPAADAVDLATLSRSLDQSPRARRALGISTPGAD